MIDAAIIGLCSWEENRFFPYQGPSAKLTYTLVSASSGIERVVAHSGRSLAYREIWLLE